MGLLRLIRNRSNGALVAFVLFFGANVLFFHVGAGNTAQQPIRFNHAKHIENGMSCTDCHAGVEQQAHATLPDLATCMTCHETAMGESPEEAKLRTLAAAKGQLRWSQVTRVPPHVYFSHRRHAQIGKLACSVCHGAMEKATAPPTHPFRSMSMNSCLNCHEHYGLRTDCDDCHR